MPKANRKRVNPRDKLRDETDAAWRSRLARMDQEERDRSQPLVTLEAQRHGDYGDVTLFEVDERGAPVRVVAQRNRATDPVARWKAKNRLTAAQIAAIDYCERLWKLAGIQQRVTANYGERIYGLSGHSESRCLNEIEARQDLHRIRGYIPGPYWHVFENIARHAMPLGETALTAGYAGPGAEIRAHTVVCFVADLIAMRERL